MKDNKTFLNIPLTETGSGAAPEPMHTEGGSGRVTGFESWMLRTLLERLGRPPLSLVLWDGKEHYRPNGKPVATVSIGDRATLWRLLRNPNLNFGDDFSRGSIRVDGDLVRCLEAIVHARLVYGHPGVVQRFLSRGLVRQRRNTQARSRRNIHHHYDLGNEFYRLWLDTEMAYTCAYFPEPTVTLEAAQLAKMDHVCRKLQLQPGETVVEAGCGWGSLARHMALNYGVKVKAYNISHEQIAFARERAAAEGFADRVEYVEDDYRNIGGHYDVFVSVGMLEHVGATNYRHLGRLMDRVLTDGGRGLIHSIGQNRPEPTSAWTEKRLFPGGYSPTLRQMMDLFEEPGFSVLDVENLRLHYAKTLEHWLARYEHNIDAVRASFDEFFVRAWRLYLAASLAHFSAGALQLYQVLFARPTRNAIPWTRAYLYDA